jgi:hypothetical protein
MDKPSSLLGLIVSDKGKKFYKIDTWSKQLNMWLSSVHSKSWTKARKKQKYLIKIEWKLIHKKLIFDQKIDEIVIE